MSEGVEAPQPDVSPEPVAPPLEQSPTPDQTPERVTYSPHMEGLQGRMLLYDHDVYALSPDESIHYDVTQEQLGMQAFRDYRVFSYASTLERVEEWDGKETGTDTKYQHWEKEMIRIVGGNQRRAHDLAILNARVGIDFEHFDPAAARLIYDKYFKDDTPELQIINGTEVYVPSNIKNFVRDTLDSYRAADGTLNYDALKQNLSSIQWFSHVFGKNSAEIVAQLIDAEAKLQTPDQASALITTVNQTETVTKPDGSTEDVRRLNKPRLVEREVELVEFLDRQLDRVRVVKPPKGGPQPGKEFVWHYEPTNKQDRHFPFKEYARSLLSPTRVAAELQRDLPDQYGSRSIHQIAADVQRSQKEVYERYNTPKIKEGIQSALTDYMRFLKEKYGMSDFYDLSDLDIHLIGSEAGKVYSDALGFMLPGAPSIYLNMHTVEQIAEREKISLSDHPDEAVMRVLREVMPHEFTHIVGQQAQWYLLRRNQDPHHDYALDELRAAADVTHGKLGPELSNPARPANRFFKYARQSRERGRWLMEAATVRLTEQWAHTTELKVSEHLDAYRHERETLDAVIDRLIKDGEVKDRDEGFRYFADAYFKPSGMLSLVRKLDGDGQGENGARRRPHFTQTIYALMEYEKGQNTDTPYDLSRAFAGGTLSDFQVGQLKRVVSACRDNPGGKVQLSPAAQAYLDRTYKLGLNIAPRIAAQQTREQDREETPEQKAA